MGKRKEELKNNSFETLQVLICLAFILSIFSFIFYLSDPQTSLHKARWQVKVLGYSVWQLFLNEQNKMHQIPDAGRKLATLSAIIDSKGLIGKDPWGKPYIYKIKENPQFLYIWSLGPNGLDESSEITDLSFRGDDVGFVLDIKTR